LAVKRLGYRVLRVRHFGQTARVELGVDELPRISTEEARAALAAAVESAGYVAVEIDERPFRSGSLNAAFTRRLTVSGS
jgi:uncharacterized protein